MRVGDAFWNFPDSVDGFCFLLAFLSRTAFPRRSVMTSDIDPDTDFLPDEEVLSRRFSTSLANDSGIKLICNITN